MEPQRSIIFWSGPPPELGIAQPKLFNTFVTFVNKHYTHTPNPTIYVNYIGLKEKIAVKKMVFRT